MIIKKSVELGFDVIGFTSIKIKDHIKTNYKEFLDKNYKEAKPTNYNFKIKNLSKIKLIVKK